MKTLTPLFQPRSVAVVGASRDRRSVGGSILHNLLTFEFQGQVFPVNPKATVVHSLKCYASVEDIPDPVDLAIIAVPKPAVAAAVESCGRKGVGALVIITAGFKETGAAGLEAERVVVDIAKRYGMRVVGPNCMGIINMNPDVRLQASFSDNEPAPGNVAFSSQSGALGEAILALLGERGLGLSMFVSLGNKADVSGNDLLEWWEADAQTGVILMYLESFGNPERFLQICRRVTRKKPVLAVKSGRTAAGARAAASHTGSLAGADIAVESLFTQSGVIRAASIEELFVYASAFASQPVPFGNRVGIVTNSGGPGILATDACIEQGLQIAPLDEATQRRIREVVAAEASVVNPVDMIATAGPRQYEASVRAVAQDPNIDIVIAIFTSLEMIDGPEVAAGIVRGAEGCGKPVLVCFMGNVRSQEAIAMLRAAKLAVYTFPEDAARAATALVRYRRWLDRPEGKPVRFDDIKTADIEALVARVRKTGRRQLTLAESQQLLDLAGFPVLAWHEAGTPDEAAAAADALGYPVAAKISSSTIVHKSDVGGVRVNLRSAEEVRDAARALLAAAAPHDKAARLVVQRMAAHGVEVILGGTRDPKFGPLVMFGLGGVFVEVLKDVTFRVHPLWDIDAHDMVRAIKGYPMLTGTRGLPPVHLPSLEQAVLRLDQLMARVPDLQEVDVNPFFGGATAADSAAADARVTLTG